MANDVLEQKIVFWELERARIRLLKYCESLNETIKQQNMIIDELNNQLKQKEEWVG